MPVRMWNSKSVHSLLVGMQNAMSTLEDLVISYKTKQSLPSDPAITLLSR